MSYRLPYFFLVITGSVSLAVFLVTSPATGWPWSIASIAAFVVGAVLGWQIPKNPISWLLLVFGAAGVVSFSMLYAIERMTNADAAAWVETIFSAVNTSAVLLFPIILLRFPNGVITSWGWRIAEWMAIVGAGIGGAAALLNGGWGGDISQAVFRSPLYEATTPAGNVLTNLFFPLFALSFLVAAISVISRYRRSEGETRLQFRWLAYSAAFLLVGLAAVVAASGFTAVATDQVWEQLWMAVAFALIPVSIGIAVLKYRLYDIDLVVSRTVVLALLAAFITVTYAVIVVGLGALIGGQSEGLLLPIAATAVVAVAFEPVRNVAQRWANRLVYGKRATPYEVLSDMTERLSLAEGGEGILHRMATLLLDGTGAGRATIWLGEPDQMTVAATEPPDASVPDTVEMDDDSVFAVLHDGEIVGALEVVKPRGSVLSTAERSLIADVAGSAGAVLGYQRLNDSLAARAEELERSRARLVGVQDQERRRLERELHEGAEQYIVALKVKIGVAAQYAAKHGAEDLEALLNGLADEAQAALDDVQSLAKGVYPPVLESDGLAAAISSLAAASPVEVRFERDGIGRYPAEIEAAVYFDVSEAVTNAVKHARPPIHIELADREGSLRFSVSDSGPGFDLDQSDLGSGLENMADRLEAVGGELTVTSRRGAETVVTGEIPVVPVPV